MSIKYHDSMIAGTPELATVVQSGNGKPVTSGAVKSALEAQKTNLDLTVSITKGTSTTISFASASRFLIVTSAQGLTLSGIYAGTSSTSSTDVIPLIAPTSSESPTIAASASSNTITITNNSSYYTLTVYVMLLNNVARPTLAT